MKTPRLLLLLAVLAVSAAACGSTNATPTPIRVDSADEAARLISLRSPLLAGIARQDPEMIGNANAWEATELAGRGDDAGWQIVFRAGWGDCEAGCIERHTWTWNVTVDGRITFAGEEGPALPPEIVDELRAAAAEREQVVGIAGHAATGPTCPVVQPGDTTCGDRTVSGAILVVRDAAGKELARVTTDEAGFFRVALAPGAYTLEAQPKEGLMGTPGPIAVTVTAGAEAWMDVPYDTGIR